MVPDAQARLCGFSMFKFSFPLDKDFLYSVCILTGEQIRSLQFFNHHHKYN